jgi:AraC-like DNA-binding protein
MRCRHFVPRTFCRIDAAGVTQDVAGWRAIPAMRRGMTITMPATDMARRRDDKRLRDPTTACMLRKWRRFLHPVARPVAASDGQASGEGIGFRLGPLAIFKTNTRDSRYLRDPALISRSRFVHHVLVVLVLRGGLRGRAGDHAMDLRRGDIGFLDLAHVAEMRASEGSQLGLVVPRAMLKGILHGLILRESQLACRMLTRHLEQLVLSLPAIEPARAETLVEATMAVAQLCIDFSPARDPDASEDQLRADILEHIDANLDDVELAPERIARDFGISRTRLYQLFLGSGGIKRCIRGKRLDAAFRDLCDERQPRVIDVAYRRGFSSERQFQRAFLARFGMTPSAVRDRRKQGEPDAS